MKQDRPASSNLTPELTERAMACLSAMHGYLLKAESAGAKRKVDRKHSAWYGHR